MFERVFRIVLLVSVLAMLVAVAILAPGVCLKMLAFGAGGVALIVLLDRLVERRRVRRVVRRLETLTTGELHAEVVHMRECLREVPSPHPDVTWFDELVGRKDLRGLAREWPRVAREFGKHFHARDFPNALTDFHLVLAEFVRRLDAEAASGQHPR